MQYNGALEVTGNKRAKQINKAIPNPHSNVVESNFHIVKPAKNVVLKIFLPPPASPLGHSKLWHPCVTFKKKNFNVTWRQALSACSVHIRVCNVNKYMPRSNLTIKLPIGYHARQYKRSLRILHELDPMSRNLTFLQYMQLLMCTPH